MMTVANDHKKMRAAINLGGTVIRVSSDHVWSSSHKAKSKELRAFFEMIATDAAFKQKIVLPTGQFYDDMVRLMPADIVGFVTRVRFEGEEEGEEEAPCALPLSLGYFKSSSGEARLNPMLVTSSSGCARAVGTIRTHVELQTESAISLDAEWTAPWSSLQSLLYPTSGIAVLVLSTDKQDFIFQLGSGAYPPILQELLKSSAIAKVGRATKGDATRLHNNGHIYAATSVGLQSSVRDICDVAKDKQVSLLVKSLASITHQLFPAAPLMSKELRCTNWDFPLRHEAGCKLKDCYKDFVDHRGAQQIEYAAIDGIAGLKCYLKLKRGAQAQGSTEMSPPVPVASPLSAAAAAPPALQGAWCKSCKVHFTFNQVTVVHGNDSETGECCKYDGRNGNA
jgi:hypothetical protein